MLERNWRSTRPDFLGSAEGNSGFNRNPWELQVFAPPGLTE